MSFSAEEEDLQLRLSRGSGMIRDSESSKSTKEDGVISEEEDEERRFLEET